MWAWRVVFIGSVFLVVLFASQVGFAQDTVVAYFTAEEGTPLIGEPISLNLTLTVPTGSTVKFPTFPVQWPPFMLTEIGEQSVRSEADRDIYHQQLTVILWQPGEFQTPQVSIEYQLPNTDQIMTVDAQPAYFVVDSVLNPDDLSLRPLKPPVALFYVPPWLGGLALVALFAALVYGWRIRRKWVGSWPVPVAQDNLHSAARAVLSDLKGVDTRRWSVARIYTFTGNALRRYVQKRFGVNAQKMTTEELVASLQHETGLSESRQRELAYLLGQTDLVKFAHVQPKSFEKMLNMAQQWVLAVEREQVGE
jgi:hypothetical protein